MQPHGWGHGRLRLVLACIVAAIGKQSRMAEMEAYRYVIVRSAAKQLRRCPRREAILQWLFNLCQDPFRSDRNVKPLTGVRGAYRRRFGDWRVSYLIDQSSRVIEVFEVAPRGGAYR